MEPLLKPEAKELLEKFGLTLSGLSKLSDAEISSILGAVAILENSASKSEAEEAEPKAEEVEPKAEEAEPKAEEVEPEIEEPDEPSSTNDPMGELLKKIKIGGPALSTSQPVQSEEDKLMSETHDDWGQEVPAGTI